MRGPKGEITPKRRCAGCGLVTDQAALQRFAVVDGRVVPDPERRLPGRGAYACNEACSTRATERRGWSRAFRSAVQPPTDG